MVLFAETALPITGPTPLNVMVDALEKVGPLKGLERKYLEWLANHGTEFKYAAGVSFFNEETEPEYMTIILKGEIHVRRVQNGPMALFIGRSGQITGLLPFSRMKRYGGTGTAVTDVWILVFHKDIFDEMLAAIPTLTQRLVGVLLDRSREVTRIEQQAEKLTALGKLSANLAHELNNPASAAQRAASGMLAELRTYGVEKYKLGALCLNPEQGAQIHAWQIALRESTANKSVDIESLETSDREQKITTWLTEHSVRDAWRIAPELAELGVETCQLEPIVKLLDPEGISVILSQLTSSIRAERIAEAMLNSTARIFELISAIKAYSFMDQAPIQEVDIALGVERTLQVMQSQLTHINVVRDYEPDLPVLSAYGGELNQVWTALIENAVEAMAGNGTLTLRICRQGEMILVEVHDTGIGIPPELTDRIFEPFFTTKAPGVALGLGLDMANRVVRKHRGFLSVTSIPGDTCFQVRIPIQQLQAY